MVTAQVQRGSLASEYMFRAEFTDGFYSAYERKWSENWLSFYPEQIEDEVATSLSGEKCEQV